MPRRKLTDADRRDWDKVAGSVRPLAKPALPSEEEGPAAKAGEPRKKPAGRAVKPENAPVPPMQAQAAPPPPPPPPTAPAIDQFAARRLRRGKGPEARIDLHGMKQAEAHPRLLAFLRGAQASGARIVLVITGKGRGDKADDWWRESERGVLRRSVPQWLATPPFRALVAGFQPAGRGHGGEGAFYVQLRSRARGEGAGK